MPPTSSRLEKILVDATLITAEQLMEAKAAENGKSIFQVLEELGYVSEQAIASTVADTLKLQLISLDNYDIDINAAALIAEETALRYKLIPVAFENDFLIVAMTDPANIFALDDIRIMTGHPVRPAVATESDVMAAIDKYCHADADVTEMMDSVAHDMDEDAVVVKEDDDEDEQDSAPIVKLVNLILTEAARNVANDVHIEPQDQDVRIRFRIDGVLHEMMRSPKKVQGGVISRIKILAGMDIAEKRVPQDGRFGTN